MHRLLPVLQRAWADLDMAPEREARQVATTPLPLEGAPHLAMDGTARRRHRPQEDPAPQAPYSGKKQAPPDTTILLGKEGTSTVV
jgi:hypothetical protein